MERRTAECLLPVPRDRRRCANRREGPRVLQQLADRIRCLQLLGRPRKPPFGIFSLPRIHSALADAAFHSVYEFDLALVPRPPSGCGAEPSTTQSVTVALLLLQTILLVLYRPSLLAFGVDGALPLGLVRAPDQVRDKAIQRILDSP